MLGEHLLKGFRQVIVRLFHGITNPAPVKLPTPMPSDPFAIGPAVYRPEYWTVFGDVDGPEPPSTARCGNGYLHRQFVLASSADAQVFFHGFQTGGWRRSEGIGFECAGCQMNILD